MYLHRNWVWRSGHLPAHIWMARKALRCRYIVIPFEGQQLLVDKALAIVRVLEEGRCVFDQPLKVDIMPKVLIERVYGRFLKNNSKSKTLGLFSAYLDFQALLAEKSPRNFWFPTGHPARKNPNACPQLSKSLGAYFDANQMSFFFTPNFAPEQL